MSLQVCRLKLWFILCVPVIIATIAFELTTAAVVVRRMPGADARVAQTGSTRLVKQMTPTQARQIAPPVKSVAQQRYSPQYQQSVRMVQAMPSTRQVIMDQRPISGGGYVVNGRPAMGNVVVKHVAPPPRKVVRVKKIYKKPQGATGTGEGGGGAEAGGGGGGGEGGEEEAMEAVEVGAGDEDAEAELDAGAGDAEAGAAEDTGDADDADDGGGEDGGAEADGGAAEEDGGEGVEGASGDGGGAGDGDGGGNDAGGGAAATAAAGAGGPACSAPAPPPCFGVVPPPCPVQMSCCQG